MAQSVVWCFVERPRKALLASLVVFITLLGPPARAEGDRELALLSLPKQNLATSSGRARFAPDSAPAGLESFLAGIKKLISEEPSASTLPLGSDVRVFDSLTDPTAWLQISAAVNGDNKKPVSLLYNAEPRALGGRLQLGFARAEATVYPMLEEAFPESRRSARVKDLVDNQSGKGDLSYSFLWRRQTDASKLMETNRFAFGRDVEQYANAISGLIEAGAVDVKSEADQKVLKTLISNQPEIKVSYVRHDPPVFGGPKEDLLTVSFDVGIRNFNRLLKLVRNDDLNPKAAYESLKESGPVAGEKEFRTSYAITYRRTKDYEFSDESLDSPFARPGEEEWKGTLGFGRRMNFSQWFGSGDGVFDFEGRLDVSIEGMTTRGDSSLPRPMRRVDRVIGRATFTFPLSDGSSLPITLIYANRPEFVMQEENFKQSLGVNFGLAYKLVKKAPK